MRKPDVMKLWRRACSHVIDAAYGMRTDCYRSPFPKLSSFKMDIVESVECRLNVNALEEPAEGGPVNWQ